MCALVCAIKRVVSMADTTQILRNLRNLSCDKIGALSHPLYRDGHFAYVTPRAEYMDQLMKRGRAMAGSLIHQGSISARRASLIKPMMKRFLGKIAHDIRIRCTRVVTDPAPWLTSRISCLRGTKFLQHSCAVYLEHGYKSILLTKPCRLTLLYT